MKKRLLVLCMSVAMLVCATVAQAAVVYDWSYTTVGVVKDVSWTTDRQDGDAGGVGAPINGGYTEYKWGGAGANSGLTIDSYSGAIVTEGTSQGGIRITHFNEPIYDTFKTLAGGTIFTTIELSGDGGLANYKVNSSISFGFFETPNDGVGYDDDIFYMTASEIMKGVGDFTYNGERYYVYLHSSVKALEGEYLRMAQEHGGYDFGTILYGWTTKEGETYSNGYDLTLRISQTPPNVPVPAAVWLMGTGLAGLAAMKRRGKK